jgi:hypothetical protein
MKPGPKSVDVDQLRFQATALAGNLWVLRDGRPGMLHSKRGVWVSRKIPLISWDEVGRPEKVTQRILRGEMEYETMRYKVRQFAIEPTTKAFRDALARVKCSKDLILVERPTVARPEIWKRLSGSRSAVDIREISRRIRQQDPLLASTLYSYAEGLLEAKLLHNYPKSKRPSSDDKRIDFFAKVLAGLRLGIAPATATKRLSHIPLRGNDAWSWVQQYSASSSRTLGKEQGR